MRFDVAAETDRGAFRALAGQPESLFGAMVEESGFLAPGLRVAFGAVPVWAGGIRDGPPGHTGTNDTPRRMGSRGCARRF